MTNEEKKTNDHLKNKSFDSDHLGIGLNSSEPDRNWLKKELLKTEEKYRRLFSASSIGTALFDLEGNYIEINDAYARILGIQKKEILGRSSIELIEEDVLGGSEGYLNQIITKGVCGGLRELTLNDKDLVLSYVDTLVYDNEEKPVGIISMVQDISELKGQDRIIEDAIRLPEEIRKKVPRPETVFGADLKRISKEPRIFNPLKSIVKRFERQMFYEIEDGDLGAPKSQGFFGKYLHKSFERDDFMHEIAPRTFWQRESKEEEF